MKPVLAALEKNIKNVAVNYKIINNKIKMRTAKDGNIIFFEYKILIISICGAFREPVSTVFANPLFLPMLRNLFFLSLKISSPDIDWKLLKFFIKDFLTFNRI